MPALRSADDHFLVVGDAVAVEHRDHHRAGRGLAVELAEHGQRRLQARDADGEAGRRHRLAAEARHQAVVAPAAADRAEAHRPAFLVLGFEQQFNLVDRAGVVFEAAHDGGIDQNAIVGVGRTMSSALEIWRSSSTPASPCDRTGDAPSPGCRASQPALAPFEPTNASTRSIAAGVEPRALGEIAALVLAAFAKQLPHAFGAQADRACRSRAAR